MKCLYPAWLCVAFAVAFGPAVLGDTAVRDRGTPRWTVRVTKVQRPATVGVPAASTSADSGRVVEPLQIEGEAEVLEHAYLVRVRIRNVSDAVRFFKWDVTRAPYLKLSDGRVVMPIGHKLPGLSRTSLAVKGSLEVNVPPGRSYTLYPVFVLQAPQPGAELVLDGAGRSPLR